jgi:hypothetical protein
MDVVDTDKQWELRVKTKDKKKKKDKDVRKWMR